MSNQRHEAFLYTLESYLKSRVLDQLRKEGKYLTSEQVDVEVERNMALLAKILLSMAEESDPDKGVDTCQC